MADYQQNFLGALQGGLDFGQQVKRQRDQSALGQLASQAYGAAPEQRTSLLGQMATISPQAAQAQQNAWDGDEDRRNRSMVNMARLLTSAPEEARPGLWRSFVPTLSQYGLSELPPEYNEQTAPIITKAAAALSQAYGGDQTQQRNLVVGPGGAIVNPQTGQELYARPFAPSRPVWDSARGVFVPAPDVAGAGGPTRNDMEADVALANDMIAAGIPEAQVDAFIRTRGQRQPQTGADNPLRAIPVEGVGPRGEDAPSGYRYGPDGSLAPIPGGPADKQNNPVAADLAKGEMGMRKEVQDRVEKDRSILNMYQNVQSAANSGTAAGDLSLIFAFMKMLDPGSVVREQEFANAQNAAGIPDRILNYRNQVLSGQRLNPNQRAQFLSEARQLASAAQQRVTGVTREYQGIADQYGWDPVRATGQADFRNVSSSVQRGGRYQPGQIIELGGKRYRVTGGDPNDPDVEEVR